MKKILLLFLICVSLVACTANDYDYEIRLAHNDSIVEQGVTKCYERWLWKGQDAQIGVLIGQINYNDTCMMLYQTVINDFNSKNRSIGSKYDKPLKVTKFQVK